MNVNGNISNEQGLDKDDWVEPQEDVEMVRHRGLILALPWSTRGEDWLKAIRPRAFRSPLRGVIPSLRTHRHSHP